MTSRFRHLYFAVALWLGIVCLEASNSGDALKTTSTDLSAGSNFVLSIVPTAAGTIDVQLLGTYVGTTLNLNGGALLFGTLNDLDATQNLVISNSAGLGGSITLATLGNSTPGASAFDLVYVAPGANLAIQNGTGSATLLLALSGNIDNAGTLSIGGPLVIGAAQTVTFTGAGATTVSGTVGGLLSSVVVNDPGGSVTLSGTNGYSGTTTIAAGTLNASNIVVNGSLTSNLGNSITAVSLGGTSTTGILNYTGSSATYTRGFTVNAGGGELLAASAGQTLTISSGGIGGSGLFTVGGAGNTAITSVIANGAGGVTKTGTGTLLLAAANSYTGPTSLNGGVVQISAANNLGTGVAGNTIGFNGGTLESTGNSYNLGANRSIALNGSGTLQVDAGNLTVDGSIGGAGTLTNAGAGTLTLAGANTFTGGLVQTAGTIALTNAGALTSSNLLTVNGGTVDLSGNSETVAGLSGSGGTISNSGGSAATLTLGGSGTTTYSGNITSPSTNPNSLNVNIALSGGGSQTLSGNNTYAGVTTVTSGTLVAGSASAFGNGGLSNTLATGGTTILAGATADLNGQSNLNEAITLNGTGAGAAGALVNNNVSTTASIGSGVSSISVGGTLTGLNANTTVSIGAPTSGSTATAAAVLGVTAGTFTISGGTTVYLSAPTVTISGGGGSGATAVAVLSGGVVTGITITNPGSGYTSLPAISFSGGTVLLGGASPSGVGVNGHFVLDGIAVTGNGSGYTAAPSVTLSSGTVTTTANITSVALASNASIGGSGSLTINAPISGSGAGLTKVGSGTLTLNAAETYTGATAIGSGTLAVGVNNALAGSTSVGISGNASLALGSNSTTVNGGVTLTNGSITGSGTLTAAVSGTSYTVVNGTVSAVLGGTGDTLAKIGDGTLAGGTVILSAANTYTGATSINGGTLQVDGSLAAGSTVTVGGASATGTPILTGSGTINGNVIVSSSGGGAAGTINPGTVGSIGTLTLGTLTVQSGGVLSFDVSGTNSDLLRVLNAATINAGAEVQISGTNLTLGNYVLATASGGLVSTNLTVVGSLPTGYLLVDTGTTLDLQHGGSQSLVSTTPTPINIISGATTNITAQLSNTAPSGSAPIVVNLSNNGGTGGVVGTFTSSTGSTVNPGSTSNVGGTFTAGTAGLNQTWSFKNTDPNSLGPASLTGAVNVYNHSAPTLAVASGNNEAGIVGSTLGRATVTLSNPGTLPTPLDVQGLSNLTGTTGSAVIATNGSGTYTSTALNTSSAGLGRTLVVGLTTGDQQTVIGATPLSALTQTITYDVYNHAAPTLTVASGNNQSAFVGGTIVNPTLTLSDGGTLPAPLDVGSLTNLTGATGSGVVASGGSATYTATGIGTGTAGIGRTLAVSLQAGDQQTITGANPLGTLSQTITYNVYNHATPTLTVTAGNNQSAIAGSTLASAVVTLSDPGTVPAPLDVTGLTNLTGATGSGVVASGGSSTYTSAAIDTSAVGAGQTLAVGLSAGDQQSIPGANPLSALTQTVTYNVYNHSTPTLTVASGNNQSVFVGGTLASPTLTLGDTGTVPAPLDVNGLSNLTGATGSGVISSGGSGTYTVTGLNTASAGVGKTVVAGLHAGDQQTIVGANPLASLNQTVTYNVYNHATSSLTSGTLDLGNIHAGYASPISSVNSLTATNGGLGDVRVDLQGSAPTAGNVSLNSLGGIVSGGSGMIAATLAPGQGAGTINSNLTYTFADDSAIAGALGNVGTALITVTGDIYTGVGTWIGNGTATGSWGTLNAGFGANWGANQGSPGLDVNFTSTDSATFGNANRATQLVTLDGANPSLDMLTFDASSTSYTIAQGSGGSITLNGGAGPATIADGATGGSQAISAPLILATDTNANVNAGRELDLSGAITGAGGLTTAGAGTVVLSGNDGYLGATTVNAGTLLVNGSTLGNGSVSVADGATLGGSGSTGQVTVADGGRIILRDGAIDSLTVSSLTVGNATTPSTLAFDIGAGSTGNVDQITDQGALTFDGAGGTVITIANVAGVPVLTDGTYALISSTGINGTLSDVSLANTALDGKTLSLAFVGNALDLVVADLTNGTTYGLSAATADSRVMVNGSTTLTSTLTNTGSADSVTYTGLDVAISGGTLSGGSAADGLAGAGASDSNTRTLSVGATTGLITITPTVGSAVNTVFGGNAILDSTSTATVDVVANRVVTATPVSFGRVLVGQDVSASSTLSTSGDDAHFTRVTVGTAGPDANGIGASGGAGAVFNGATVTDSRTVGGTFTTAGTVNGTLTLPTTGEGLAGETPVDVALAYSADPVNPRVIANGAATNLGTLHSGSVVNVTSNAFTTTGTHDTTTDVEVAAAGGAADANGITLTGAATILDGTTSSGTRIFGGTVASSTGGTIDGSFLLPVTTLENGGLGLPGEGAYNDVTVAYAATVYTGQGVWNAPGGGSYGTIDSPVNWTVAGGAPGLDPNFTTTDSATFGNSIGSNSVTVTLDGDSPSLDGITFSNTAGGAYNLAPGSSGTLVLDLGGGTAVIDNASGNNTISAPTQLQSDMAVTTGSGTSLLISGPIGEQGGSFGVDVGGSGTTTFAADNTFSGGTTLDSGTLDIVGAGTLGAPAGSLTINGGTLDLGATSQTVGAVTITGASDIRDGTLTGSSYSITNPSGIVTIDAQLGGNGGLTKSGDGTLALNGNNTYGGGTIISGGRVEAGSLQPFGTGDVTLNGGTLTTGNGIHQIDVAGDYHQNGGTLLLNVSGTAPGASPGYDTLNVTGTATLGGTLYINVASSYVPPSGQTFDFVQAGNVSGNFADIVSSEASLGLISNGGGSVTVTQLPFSTLAGMDYTPNQFNVAAYIDRSYQGGAASPAFQTLVAALDSVTTGGAKGLPGALDQLTVQNFANFSQASIINNETFSTEIFDRYRQRRRNRQGDFSPSDPVLDSSGVTAVDPAVDPNLAQIDSSLRAWQPARLPGSLFGEPSEGYIGSTDGWPDSGREPKFNVFVAGNVTLSQGSVGSDLSHFDSTTAGIEVGANYQLTRNFEAGLLFKYNHTDANLDGRGSNAEIDSFEPGVYVSFAEKGWYANAMAGYAFDNYDQERDVDFGGLSGTARAKPSGQHIVGDLDGGHDFHVKEWTISPEVGVQYTKLHIDRYSENGFDLADLNVDSQSGESLRSRVGARVEYSAKLGKVTLTPHLDAFWQYEFLNPAINLNEQLASVGAGSFPITVQQPGRNSALVDGGLSADFSGSTTVFLDYIVEAGQSDYFSQSVEGGVRVGF